MKNTHLLRLLAGFSVLVFSLECFSEDLYVKAEVGTDSNLHIFTESGKQIVIKRENYKENGDERVQESFEKIKLSNDRRSVGWLSMYKNCCTSYPIPLSLNIYTNKRVYSFAGIGLPVWQWNFQSNDQYVAFHQETVHGGFGSHFELREIKTNTLIDSFDPEVDQNDQPIESQKMPVWTESLVK